MNEEVNAVLQVYQNRVSTLLAQNIALEAKLTVANNTVKKLLAARGVLSLILGLSAQAALGQLFSDLTIQLGGRINRKRHTNYTLAK